MDKIKIIERELSRRAQPKIDVLSYCFQQQREFIEDPTSYKAAFTTRRAGKSTALGVYIVKTALDFPSCNILYLGLSKDTAIRVLWKDILEPILEHFKIKVHYTDKQITFPNGSVLFAQGTNASDRELSKVLGLKFKLALLDEAQSYTINTYDLVHKSLGYTMQDLQGTIVMAGLRTDAMNTYFYEITKQKGKRAPGWKVHTWTTFDNIIPQEDGVSQAEKAKMDIAKWKKTIPNYEETDWFQQQQLGKWVILNESKVYRFNEDRNLILDASILLTLKQDKNWYFVLGVDFGWTDESALCVLAYHRLDENIYLLESEKHKHWDLGQLASRIHDLNKSYKFSHIVGDSAAAQSIATLARQYQLPIKPINKPGKKRESIAIINADFIIGRIKIDSSNNLELLTEIKELIWDPRKLADGEYIEAAKFDNHICFVAGTKIATSTGQKNIEDIKIGDLILTRKGFKKSIAAGQTGIKPIYKLTTKNDKELFGTKDHPIFSNNKFISLCELKTGNILTCIEEQQEHTCQKTKMENALNLSTMESPILGIQSQNKHIIETTGNVVQTDFIELFGQNILESYLMVTIFTTLTMIHSIMILAIFNFLPQKNIKSIIHCIECKIKNMSSNLMKVWIKQEKLLQNGMHLKKALLGTFNMEKTVGKIKNRLNIFVQFAMNHSQQEQIEQMSAQTNVLLNSEEILELMMKPESVQLVKKNIQPTNILNLNIVPDIVSTIENANIFLPVYNLTVEDQHEYFANGILVSNCDAMLYAYRVSRHYRAGTEVKKLDINDKMDRFALLDQADLQETSIYDRDSIFHKQTEEEILFKLNQLRNKKV